jgi:hypothetical protein
MRRRSTARSTIRMISTSRARVRKARMRRWNYATPARSQAAKRRNFRSVMKQFGEVRQGWRNASWSAGEESRQGAAGLQ